MAYPSQPDLLVLHAVRILGMADGTAVARRFRLDLDVTEELLLDSRPMAGSSAYSSRTSQVGH